MTINYKGEAVRAITTLGLAGVDITEWPITAPEVAAVKSNIGYNTAFTAGLVSMGQLNLNDGVVNPFSNEDEIDLALSSNQVYDSAGKFYKNALSAATQSWNTVTSGSTTGAVDTSYRNVLPGSQITTSGGFCRVTLTARVTGEGMKLDNVSIGERSGATGDTVTAPVEFLFGGNSGTGIVTAGNSITSDWLEFPIDETRDYLVILDVGSDSSNDEMAAPVETGTGFYVRTGFNGYNVQSGAGYSFGTDQLVAVTKLEVTDEDENVTLQSRPITANAIPTEAHLSFLITPLAAITPNTDLKGYVSRDGGTTWSEATLSAQTVGLPWQSMLSGGVDLNSQPSGLSMKWKFVSANNKQFHFDNVSLFWN